MTNNTTTNDTIILYDLYASVGEIVGYSIAYGILSSMALIGKLLYFLYL